MICSFFTNVGMAWRIKLQKTSLVILEYVVKVEKPFMLNSEHKPVLALAVGEDCTSKELQSFTAGDVTDSRKLFLTDKKSISLSETHY